MGFARFQKHREECCLLKSIDYLMISVFFVLLLALFLFFNPDVYPSNALPDTDYVISRKSTGLERQNANQNVEIAVIAGSDTVSRVADNISFTLDLLHQSYFMGRSVQEIGGAKITIMAAPNLKSADLPRLKEYLAGGGTVIFATMPDSPPEELAELLGVTSYSAGYRALGIDIYEGILLGGMFRAEEFPLNCAHVTLSGRCKAFAHGYADPALLYAGSDVGDSDRTPLIWRTDQEGGAVYVINAPFLEDPAGSGLLTGVLSLAFEDLIYPIVGTKTVVLDHFPCIAGEDALINGRSAFVYARDAVWPDLLSIAKRLGITYTCYTDSGFLQGGEAVEAIGFLNNELRKRTRGEIGYWTGDRPELAVVESDMAFLRDRVPEHAVQSIRLPSDFGASELSLFGEVTAFVAPSWEGGCSWAGESAVKLPVISSGVGGDETRFAFTSAVSSLGLAVHSVDMEPLFTGERRWNDYAPEIGKFLTRLFQDKTYLEAAPVKDTAEALKDYLNMEMTVLRESDRLRVSTQYNALEMSFILRSPKSIDVKGCVNCSVQTIEDGVYRITSRGPDFSIQFI